LGEQDRTVDKAAFSGCALNPQRERSDTSLDSIVALRRLGSQIHRLLRKVCEYRYDAGDRKIAGEGGEP
jgi:hypothetical protein